VLQHDFQWDLALPCHGLEGKEKQLSVSSTTLSPVSRSISLFLFNHREGSEEAIGHRTRGFRFTQGWLPTLWPRGVTTEEVKRQAITGIVKWCSKHMFTCHPNSSHDTPATSCDTTTVFKMGPMIDVGPQ
jgi:hypothetical protein